MEKAMTELAEVEIDICRKTGPKHYEAVSSDQLSYNLIEKNIIDALQVTWTRVAVGITYDFIGFASPPLGQCRLDWRWKERGATWCDTFTVVEEIKATSRGVVIGLAGKDRPNVPSSNDVYVVTLDEKSRGIRSSPILKRTR